MRIILHLDLDAFFAAVEEREKSYLKGLPIVVGADPAGGRGRGVVSTANYQARVYGIHSAMPISLAWRRSKDARRTGKPEVIFITPHFKKYEEVSQRIEAILKTFTPLVEAAGIDEFYLDVSEVGSFEKARVLAETIKGRVKAAEQLTSSIGIGPNRLIAKIGSGTRKPDGLTVVSQEAAEAFLEPLPVRSIPGVGPKTEAVLFRQGIKTVGDAKKLPREKLIDRLGKWGGELFTYLRGKDESPLVFTRVPKSVGEQETLPEDTHGATVLVALLEEMVRRVFKKLKREGFSSFRTVVVTVRFADFETHTRSKTLRAPAQDESVLAREALHLFLPFLDHRENPNRRNIRLVGVRVEKIL